MKKSYTEVSLEFFNLSESDVITSSFSDPMSPNDGWSDDCFE